MICPRFALSFACLFGLLEGCSIHRHVIPSILYRRYKVSLADIYPNHNPNQVAANEVLRRNRTLHMTLCDAYAKAPEFNYLLSCIRRAVYDSFRGTKPGSVFPR